MAKGPNGEKLKVIPLEKKRERGTGQEPNGPAEIDRALRRQAPQAEDASQEPDSQERSRIRPTVGQVRELQGQVESLTRELGRERQVNADLTTQVEDRDAEIRSKNARIEQANGELEGKSREIRELQTEKGRLLTRNGTLETEKGELERAKGELEGKVAELNKEKLQDTDKDSIITDLRNTLKLKGEEITNLKRELGTSNDKLRIFSTALKTGIALLLAAAVATLLWMASPFTKGPVSTPAGKQTTPIAASSVVALSPIEQMTKDKLTNAAKDNKDAAAILRMIEKLPAEEQSGALTRLSSLLLDLEDNWAATRKAFEKPN
ncbi:hypothetical protein HY570_00090 [Candidatus Micrarchaeota archaeon]|nr:hypothetical protein [Candidatus Micrarchaeota archaeon]